MNRLFLFIVGIGLFGVGLSTGATAATVWAPNNTAENTNILLTTYYTGTGSLALFDDSNQSFTSPGLILNNNDTITFIQTTSGYLATNGAGDTLALSDTYNFILGMSQDNGSTWVADTYYVELTGANAFQVYFGDIGQTLVADVQIVPLPAAFWLFSSALIGLLGVTRCGTRSGLKSRQFDLSTPFASLRSGINSCVINQAKMSKYLTVFCLGDSYTQ